MNKTVSINLNGLVFQIDDIAFNKLNGYLNTIRNRFEGTEGVEEIMDDIEARIAEMFNERLSNRKEVISMRDVDHVIGVMGKPEDFGDVDEEEEPLKQTYSGRGVSSTRRLFRDPDSKVVGGVCSGISAYLGIDDPLWLRILFLIAFFGFGTGLILYIILMLIIPEAKTTTEKLQMRGEPINIDNIEKSIKDELHDIKDSFSSKKKVSKAHNGIVRLVGLMVTIAGSILKFFIKFIAVIFIVVGITLAISFIIAPIISWSFANYPPFEFLNLYFENYWQIWLGIIGVILVAFMPCIIFILIGKKILSKSRIYPKGFGRTVFILFLIGLVSVIGVSVSMDSHFSEKEEIMETMNIIQPNNDILFLEQSGMVPDYSKKYDLEEWCLGEYYWSKDSLWQTKIIKLDIVESKTNKFTLSKSAIASGKYRELAHQRASVLDCEVEQKDSLLLFPGFLYLDRADKLRDQEIKFVLGVPEGQSVYIGKSMRHIIYDIKNVTNTWDGNMINHTWTMTSDGLNCFECDFKKSKSKSSFYGKSSEKYYVLEDFDEIEINGAFNTTISYDENYSVKIKGGDKFLKHVEVIKNGDKLVIDGSDNWGSLWHEVSLKINLPYLNRIELNGANKFNIKGFEKSKEVYIELGGASIGSVNIITEELTLDIAGASKVSLTGAADEFNIDSKGASKIMAYNMKAKECTVELAGASLAEINVENELDATLDGASKLVYKGLPEIQSDVNGFSSIKPFR